MITVDFLDSDSNVKINNGCDIAQLILTAASSCNSIVTVKL